MPISNLTCRSSWIFLAVVMLQFQYLLMSSSWPYVTQQDSAAQTKAIAS